MAEGVVSFADWQKLDLRVGKILSVEDHPNADKLYVLEVDVGEAGKRKVVAGLRPFYKAKDLKGKFCIVFLNLEPATFRGIKSEGMILAAGDGKDGKVFLLKPEKEIALGAIIK